MMMIMEEQIKNHPSKKFYISNFCAILEEIGDSKKNLKNIRKKQYDKLIISQESGVKIHLKF